MPFMTVRLAQPGVKTIQTPTLLTANIVESDLIRWRGGLPEKMGGWQQYYKYSLNIGIIRELWAWADLNNQLHLAAGGDSGVNVITNQGGTLLQQDITPLYNITTPTISFTTNTTTPQNVVINDVGSNCTTYQSITLQTPVSVGGAVIRPGNYPIISVQSPDQYTIQLPTYIGSPPLPNAAVTGGQTALFTCAANSANITVTLNNHGLGPGSNFSVVLATTVPTAGGTGSVTLSGIYVVQSVTDANNFVIASNVQTTVAGTAYYGNLAGKASILHWVIVTQQPAGGGWGIGSWGTGSNPGEARASAAVTTGSVINIQAPPAPIPNGTFAAGTVLNDVTSGRQVGTLASISASAITIQQANPMNPVASGDLLMLVGSANSAWGLSPAPPPITGTKLTSNDWCIENWGSEIILNPDGYPLFHWNPTTGLNQAQAITAGPTQAHGFFLAMPEQQIVAYGASTLGVQDPMLVAWCDNANYGTWVAGVANQAGTYRLTRGSKIVGGIQGPQQAMLWTDVGLWLMQYIGYPDVYGFNEIARGCGLVAKKAVCVVGNMVIWASRDAFWAYANGAVQQLPCDVWEVFVKNLNPNYLDHIRAGANTGFNEFILNFPSRASSGENDMYVKMNTLSGEWDYGFWDVSEWTDISVLGHPLSAMLDASGANSVIMQHEMNMDANAVALPYKFRSSFFQLSEGEDFVFVDYCIPDFRWKRWRDIYVTPVGASAQVQLTFFVQDIPDEELSEHAVQIGPFPVTDDTGAIDLRCRGRYFSFQVAGNDLGSFVRLGGIKFRFAPDGRGGGN